MRKVEHLVFAWKRSVDEIAYEAYKRAVEEYDVGTLWDWENMPDHYRSAWRSAFTAAIREHELRLLAEYGVIPERAMNPEARHRLWEQHKTPGDMPRRSPGGELIEVAG